MWHLNKRGFTFGIRARLLYSIYFFLYYYFVAVSAVFSCFPFVTPGHLRKGELALNCLYSTEVSFFSFFIHAKIIRVSLCMFRQPGLHWEPQLHRPVKPFETLNVSLNYTNKLDLNILENKGTVSLTQHALHIYKIKTYVRMQLFFSTFDKLFIL